jgi:hypothetical protein
MVTNAKFALKAGLLTHFGLNQPFLPKIRGGLPFREGNFALLIFSILPPDIHITEAVIGYSPDEADNLVVNHGVH